MRLCFFMFLQKELNLRVSGYENDERGSLGKEYDRRQWRMKGIFFDAAVEKNQADARCFFRVPQIGVER